MRTSAHCPAALAAFALAACEPVLLVGETAEESAVVSQETSSSIAGHGAASAVEPASDGESHSTVLTNDAAIPAADDDFDDESAPNIELTIKAVDCGTCFDVSVSGRGGQPPYRYEWEDGSRNDLRHLCVDSGQRTVSAFAEDSAGRRSVVTVASLQADEAAADGCAAVPTSTTPLCAMNLSFEGPAAINTGQVFSAPPWSDCSDAAAGTLSNTPDIASDSLDPVTGIAPPPTDGLTYLAMVAGEQASQQLCDALSAGSITSLQLDAISFELGGPEVVLEIWGGDSATCSRRELLWRSSPLPTSWQTYCVTLEPSERMNQITLRADAQVAVSSVMTTYLAVDNIVPVPACP
jgi:hypothetical protein